MDKIAVAQTTSSGNWRENIEKAKQYIKKATEEEAVMIIFQNIHELLSGC